MKEAYEIRINEQGHIGYAVIINNYSFHNQRTGRPEPRLGSDLDVKKISSTLERLRFKLHDPIVDVTTDQLSDKLREILKLKDLFEKYSCFACFIMSHGNDRGEIYGIDWKTLRLNEDIVYKFRDCETLHGKPKLFFVQACRGDLFMFEFRESGVDDGPSEAVEFNEDIKHNQENETEKAEHDRPAGVNQSDNELGLTISEVDDGPSEVVGFNEDINSHQEVAAHVNYEVFSDQMVHQRAQIGDILTYYATVEGYVAIRRMNEKKVCIGSCFILSLCHVLNEYVANRQPFELNQMIKKVNRRVLMEYKCQQPQTKSSINWDLYLYIEEPVPPLESMCISIQNDQEVKEESSDEADGPSMAIRYFFSVLKEPRREFS
jgi:hypothetical protein